MKNVKDHNTHKKYSTLELCSLEGDFVKTETMFWLVFVKSNHWSVSPSIFSPWQKNVMVLFQMLSPTTVASSLGSKNDTMTRSLMAWEWVAFLQSSTTKKGFRGVVNHKYVKLLSRLMLKKKVVSQRIFGFRGSLKLLQSNHYQPVKNP